MPTIVVLFLFPLVLSLALLILPLRNGVLKGWITLAASLLMLGASLRVFIDTTVWQAVIQSHFPLLLHKFSQLLVFSTEGISGILILFLAIMLPILAGGAIIHERETPSENHFYSWFLLMAGLSFAIFSTQHIYTFLFIWGVAAVPLFMLVSGKTDDLAATGKKTLILFGSAHGLMATGAVMAVALSGTPYIDDIQLDTSIAMHRISFLLLLSGGLMTVGIIPVHSWIISTGRFASSRVIALMPLVLMRFAGIYLVIRLCHDLFIPDFYTKLFVYILAAFTTLWSLALGLREYQRLMKLMYFHIAAGGLALMGIAARTHAGLVLAVSVVAGASAILSIGILYYPSALYNGEQTKDRQIFSLATRMENSGFTDLYHGISKLVFSIHRPLSRLHDGVLQTYLVWVMAALVILFLLNGILYGH